MNITNTFNKASLFTTNLHTQQKSDALFCAQLCVSQFGMSDMKINHNHDRKLSQSLVSEDIPERTLFSPNILRQIQLPNQLRGLYQNPSVISQHMNSNAIEISRLSYDSNHNLITNDQNITKLVNDVNDSRSIIQNVSKIVYFDQIQTILRGHTVTPVHTPTKGHKQRSSTQDKENTPMDLINSNISKVSSIVTVPQTFNENLKTPRLPELTVQPISKSIQEIQSQLRTLKDISGLNKQKRKIISRQLEKEQKLLKQQLIENRAQLKSKDAVINELQTRCRIYLQEVTTLKQQNFQYRKNNTQNKNIYGKHLILLKSSQIAGDYNNIGENNPIKALYSSRAQSKIIEIAELKPIILEQLKVGQAGYRLQVDDEKEKIVSNNTKLISSMVQLQSKLAKQLQLVAKLEQQNEKLKYNNDSLTRNKQQLLTRIGKYEGYRSLTLKLESTIKLIVDLVTNSQCQCCSIAKLLLKATKPTDQTSNLQGSVDFNLSDASQCESRFCSSLIPK